MKLEELRSKLFYQGLLLGGVALLTSAALAFASRATDADIKAAEAADLKQSLAQVLPGEYENDLLKDTVMLPGKEGEVLVYRGRRGGKVEAVVYRVIGHGYAGNIVCVMGVSREGKILGVRVINHKETPGLGDKIEKDRAFVSQFAGAQAPLVGIKTAKRSNPREVVMITGATISSKAVIRIINNVLKRLGPLVDAYPQEDKG